MKDYDEPLWDGCINLSNLLVIAQMFTIKSDNRHTQVDEDDSDEINVEDYEMKMKTSQLMKKKTISINLHNTNVQCHKL
jgi:hypothetical protein